MSLAAKDLPAGEELRSHNLKRVLGLRDLIPMQILIVIGPSWTGTAAHQSGTQITFWLLSACLLFLPVAAVVQYCVRIWPLEGGVYQWTKHAFGPFAGFLSAWNLGAWVLLIVSSIGVQTAGGVSYALGAGAEWIADDTRVIVGLDLGLFGLMYLINVPGLRVGRWLAHLGTAASLMVVGMLGILLLFHPDARVGHPHVSPQAPFSLQLPALTLLSLNLFSKIAINGFTGLEQVAVFAGETRDPARAVLRSAWISAPLIAGMYIVMTGALLCYTAADQVDLVNPVAQAIARAFDSGGDASGAIWGAVLARATIVALTLAIIAQNALFIAETSRLPMVAGWDHLMPAWFTRLHPRFRTPTRSLAVISIVGALFSILASSSAGAGEAFQLLVTSGFICYGVNYLLMFAVPLLLGTRFSHQRDLRAPGWVRVACVCGGAVTLLSMVFNLVPIVPVSDPQGFALKVAFSAVAINLIGAVLFWKGSRAPTR